MGSVALPEAERVTGGWAPQVLETALLVLLKQQPRHGYALVGPIEELGVEVGDITRLYRALRHLESEGVVASTWDTEARGKGPARKVYSLTRHGNRYLRQRIKTLRANADVMNRIDRQYSEMMGELS
ncbi:MAG: helix-turn-helix transcriptional regulator [Actinomycetota bacterium]|nr:helix-turn-helix transcriptional regulator [Actinomycetota bacterium]